MIVTIEQFLKLPLKDEVFIIETDTVYGMGCLMNSRAGAERILKIKNRPTEKHFSLLVSNLEQVSHLAKNFEDSLDLINEYWPGAVTFIFEKRSDNVPVFVSSDETIGLRMPDNEKTLRAIEKFGPIIMTSVNKSGEPSITKFEDCLKFEKDVDYIVKGGDLHDLPSTVYDIKNHKVLRQGSVVINL